ncbi:MAG: UPF0149 family protein [Motiliproteus sp.]|nr:UPF0149 family protein [Motiliproteus sp.]MCW9051365.1 UPF0149 family protein [Motiliproteus sp.]
MLSADSNDKALPDFDDLASAILQVGGLGSPSELHGCLCGQLAAGGRQSNQGWIDIASELLDVNDINETALYGLLLQLYAGSLGQLESDDFGFGLLLPDEEVAMSQRADALGLWCHGFLSGYAMAGGELETGLSDDAQSALQDMVQVSQIDADQDDDGDEADFTEVYEYVRMSVLLVFSECNRSMTESGSPAGESLH